MLAQETLTLSIPLTSQERNDLSRYEGFIEQNLQTLFEVGKAFAQIRDAKLYRETHKTFEEYCVARWKISRPRAYQLIDASIVQKNLSTIVDKSLPLPTNESQTRALKKVAPEKQPELWSKAVQQNGNAPTAKQVIQVIETEFEEKKPKDYRTVPTHKDMIRVVKAWLSLRFPKFDEALSELKELCVPWRLKEPHISILHELNEHLEQLYIINYKRFNVRDACKAALKDWESLNPEELKHLDPEEAAESEELDTSEQEPEQTGAWCSFCLEDLPLEKLYSGVNPTIKICRTCAATAQIDLLHPNDSEVIVECQQIEEQYIHNFQPRRSSDLDKIIQTGCLRIFCISEHQKMIKQYTRANSTIAEGVDITWGSWKTFEKFNTKKAMMERAKELENESDVIFDGRI